MSGNPVSPQSRRVLGRAVLAVAVLLAAERPLAAYADPGSGALLWQVLVAGFVGALFYLRRLKTWLRGKWKGTNE